MAKLSITRAEYLQLLGLDALARRHAAKIDDIRNAMYELLDTSDEEDKQGHISDLIWAGDQVSLNMCLDRMDVRVEEAPDADS